MASLLPPVALLGVALGPLTCLDGAVQEDESQAEPRALWLQECADCHGPTGDGDGTRSKSLARPAPSFRDPCRRVTDEWIERVILSGGASYGGSAEMRPYHELDHDPEMLRGLVTFVQAMRQDGACVAQTQEPPIEAPP